MLYVQHSLNFIAFMDILVLSFSRSSLEILLRSGIVYVSTTSSSLGTILRPGIVYVFTRSSCSRLTLLLWDSKGILRLIWSEDF